MVGGAKHCHDKEKLEKILGLHRSLSLCIPVTPDTPIFQCKYKRLCAPEFKRSSSHSLWCYALLVPLFLSISMDNWNFAILAFAKCFS